MADVFEEVEEQLRSARLQTIIVKGWPWALGVLIAAAVVTLGVWGWRQHEAAESAKASQAYQQALDALSRRDNATADKLFAGIAKEGPKAYRALALMQEAGLRANDGKTAEATSLLDQAAGLAPDPLLADEARLKAAYMVLDTASLADVEARLTPLTQAGRPYATLAREALAMKRLASGQAAAARQDLRLLATAPDASEGLQARAQIAMAVIDAGQGAALPAAIKAAATVSPAEVAQARAAAQARALAAQAAQAGAQLPPGAVQEGAPAEGAAAQPNAAQPNSGTAQ